MVSLCCFLPMTGQHTACSLSCNNKKTVTHDKHYWLLVHHHSRLPCLLPSPLFLRSSSLEPRVIFLWVHQCTMQSIHQCEKLSIIVSIGGVMNGVKSRSHDGRHIAMQAIVNVGGPYTREEQEQFMCQEMYWYKQHHNGIGDGLWSGSQRMGDHKHTVPHTVPQTIRSTHHQTPLQNNNTSQTTTPYLKHPIEGMKCQSSKW